MMDNSASSHTSSWQNPLSSVYWSLRNKKYRFTYVILLCLVFVLFSLFMLQHKISQDTIRWYWESSGTQIQSAISSGCPPCASCHTAKLEQPAAVQQDLSPPSDRKLALEQVVRMMFADTLHPITGSNFVGDDGTEYTLPQGPTWSHALGQDLCIFDTENRAFDEENQPFSKEHFTYEKLRDHSPGIFNHYLYAMMHGYRYNYVQTPKYESDRKVYWSKIPAISDMLHSGCRIVVAIDHDAVFWNMQLPFEWLLSRWNFTSETSFAMALDPKADQNNDEFHKLNINAGFIIAQDLPRTHEILRAWDSCPSNETEFTDCRRYIANWPAEQGAWGTHIRYKFDHPNDHIDIPCTEANGFPGMNTECFGTLVRHYTIGKDRVTGGIATSLTQLIYSLIQKHLLQNQEHVKLVRASNDFEKSWSYPGGGAHGDKKPEPPPAAQSQTPPTTSPNDSIDSSTLLKPGQSKTSTVPNK